MNSAPQVPPSYLLLTLSEAARYASVGYSTLKAAVASGECRSIGRGKMRRVRVAWVEEWIESHSADQDDESGDE